MASSMGSNKVRFSILSFVVLVFFVNWLIGEEAPNSLEANEKTVAQAKSKYQLRELTLDDYSPYHTQVMSDLQLDGQVIPKVTDLHPVTAMYNRESIIPPMCYTKTEGQHNPCYVCHQDAIEGRENVMNDQDLQEAYSFSDVGLTNHWKNLFRDRSLQVASISDHDIENWINQDNYSELAGRLEEAGFEGWIPDLKNLQYSAAAFDKDGFALDGSHWVAFNYKPLPSTFWPTNGSTDDVMIRLPKPFRLDQNGKYSKDVYLANLAIVEATIKGKNRISIMPLDESRVGKDLNGDGRETVIQEVTEVDQYVGQAENFFIDTYLYPEGTEFLHTVRYVGIDDKGDLYIPQRMKEVRYMRKWNSLAKQVLHRQYQLEHYEKQAGNLPGYEFLKHNGLDNGGGWGVQGFIEDSNGRLRFTTYEENFFCMGCHSSIGSTIDKTFSFARKVDGAEGWKYIDLKGMPDAPNMGEVKGEILTYFERAGGGGEFRSNPEMEARWFHDDGTVNYDKVAQAKDVHDLITPSKQRALEMNKAYKVIVEEQSFMYGRDATVTPPHNVYEKVSNDTSPTLPDEAVYKWDIRLNWN